MRAAASARSGETRGGGDAMRWSGVAQGAADAVLETPRQRPGSAMDRPQRPGGGGSGRASPSSAWSSSGGGTASAFDRGGRAAAASGGAAAAALVQRRCAGCCRPILGHEDALQMEGGVCYHTACFSCSVCRRALPRTAGSCRADRSGSLVCESCAAARATRCAGCGAEITGRYIEVEGKPFHKECFVCSKCRRQISGKYSKSEDGSFQCAACYEAAHPPEICAECGGAIRDGRVMRSGGKTYHVACFSCSKCRRPIDGQYWRADDGGRLCKECQPRCSACNEPLDGRSFVRLKGGVAVHSECFKCCDCRGRIDGRYFEVPSNNPFRSSDDCYRCDKCHLQAIQRREDYSGAKAVAEEERKKQQDAHAYNLYWRQSLVPSARQALLDLGMDQSVSLRPDASGDSASICVCVPPPPTASTQSSWSAGPTGAVCIAGVPQQNHGAAVSLPYLACALRVLRECRREPQFSLDPKDPHDLSGPLLVKRFYPPWLAGTVVGEVLFQADYALKQLCFGDKRLPGIPSAFDNDGARSGGEPRAARQWFTVRSAGVTVTSDGVLVPFVSMGVEARRLTTGPNGYTDAPYTDPEDPWARQAAAVTARFGEVVSQLPVARELLEVARATVLAVYLLGRGFRCDDGALERYRLPRVPEGGTYSMEIPTLVKDRRTASVSTADDGSEIMVSRMSRSMRGGVDLCVPHGKRLPVRNVTAKLLGERPRPVRLPLFALAPPMAASELAGRGGPFGAAACAA